MSNFFAENDIVKCTLIVNNQCTEIEHPLREFTGLNFLNLKTLNRTSSVFNFKDVFLNLRYHVKPYVQDNIMYLKITYIDNCADRDTTQILKMEEYKSNDKEITFTNTNYFTFYNEPYNTDFFLKFKYCPSADNSTTKEENKKDTENNSLYIKEEENVMTENSTSTNLVQNNNQMMGFGMNTDPNIVDTMFGIAVFDGTKWNVYDKEENKIVDVGMSNLPNMPLYLMPAMNISVGDIIKDGDEYYCVTKGDNDYQSLINLKTGDIKTSIEKTNMFGLNIYTKVITTSSMLKGENVMNKKMKKMMLMSMMCGQNGNMFNMNMQNNTSDENNQNCQNYQNNMMYQALPAMMLMDDKSDFDTEDMFVMSMMANNPMQAIFLNSMLKDDEKANKIDAEKFIESIAEKMAEKIAEKIDEKTTKNARQSRQPKDGNE